MLHNEAACPVGKSRRATFNMVVNFRLGFTLLYSINMTLSHKEAAFNLQVYTPQAILLSKQHAGHHNFLSHSFREITSDCLPRQRVALSSVCDIL